MWYPNMDEKTFIKIQEQHLSALTQQSSPKSLKNGQGHRRAGARGCLKMFFDETLSRLRRLAAMRTAAAIRK